MQGFGCRLEVNPAIDDETPHSTISTGIQARGKAGDLSESADSVDRCAWIPEVRVVQNVDGVDPEFELFSFRDFESFHHVHVEVKESRPAQSIRAEIPNLSGLRVYQDNLAFRIGYGFVCIERNQAIAVGR